MSAKINADLGRLALITMPFAGLLLVSTAVVALETVTMEVETQAIDLDTGAIIDEASADPALASTADIKLAYNADRSPHSVVFPAAEGVELAVAAGIGFDGISSDALASLSFSSNPVDVPFSPSDCVVVRTNEGVYYKLGNAVEIGVSVTFNSERIL